MNVLEPATQTVWIPPVMLRHMLLVVATIQVAPELRSASEGYQKPGKEAAPLGTSLDSLPRNALIV